MDNEGYSNSRNNNFNEQIIDFTKNEVLPVVKKKTGEYIENVLTNRPSNINNLINKFGNNTIVEISVCRQPIEKMNKILLHAATLGQLNAKLKELNYDDIFHLYINIKLDNGLKFGIEKNETVYVLRGGMKPLETTDCKIVEDLDIKVSTFFINGEKRGGKNFYRYNFDTDNCQKFVNDLLVSNGIRYLSSFVLQKLDQILKDKDLNGLGRTVVDAYALYSKATRKEDIINDEKVKDNTVTKPKVTTVVESKPMLQEVILNQNNESEKEKNDIIALEERVNKLELIVEELKLKLNSENKIV